MSPITGKFFLIGVLEVIGHFNSDCFVTIENCESEAMAVRSGTDLGIVGWLQKRDAKAFKLIKERGLTVYLRPISSPYTVKKETNKMEFEFRQKGTMLIEVYC